ncbi:MAG: hypothetical protein CBC25_07670 [Pelagibacteraceae bacterium TMED65]|nr:MAG: hypothetical protein CBC25_07670 [Pelagibacteraceae bacterium TMED65]|tara:strand:- start:5967 stop:6842 length:876 start_codon:yes stop_codon:yes gene_type:complete
MINSLVSVIIPTCKRSNFIVRAINSVLNQTYKNIEIIVVDDNNEGDKFRKRTENILRKFIINKKIKYLKHKYNLGISAARNTGVQSAKGEYIAFLDDDDQFLPNKTKEQIKIFNQSSYKVGLVYGAYLEINNQNGKERVIFPKIKNNFYSILGINHLGPPSMVMFSKVAIKKIGKFDVNLNHKEDIDYYFRLSKYFKISYTNEVLCKYYIHQGGSSKNDYDRLVKMLKYLKKHNIKMRKPKIRWSEVQERLGDLYMLNGNRSEAIRPLIIAYKNRPMRIKILIKLFFSLFK